MFYRWTHLATSFCDVVLCVQIYDFRMNVTRSTAAAYQTVQDLGMPGGGGCHLLGQLSKIQHTRCKEMVWF